MNKMLVSGLMALGLALVTMVALGADKPEESLAVAPVQFREVEQTYSVDGGLTMTS